MYRIFIGYDHRQPLAYNVLQHSIVRHSSKPVSITPLIIEQLPIKRRGLTDFTFSRFLVPYLCNFEGKALFLDADMVVTGDIVDLFKNPMYDHAVHVMKEQPRFEWPSAMLFNNQWCDKLTPEYIDNEKNDPFQFTWGEVGSFPDEWNHCVGYQNPKEAKLYHYTQGIPCWHETKGLVEDAFWEEERELLTHTVEWKELMGHSVHAKQVLRRMMQKYVD